MQAVVLYSEEDYNNMKHELEDKVQELEDKIEEIKEELKEMEGNNKELQYIIDEVKQAIS